MNVRSRLRLRLQRIFDSPIYFVALLGIIVALCASWRHYSTRNQAPQIEGYAWSQHPQTLMLVYPLADACSTCNLSMYGWAELGTPYKLDTLIVAAKPTTERKQLQAHPPRGCRLTIISNAPRALIERFSRGDKIGGVRVNRGHIVNFQLGGTPESKFFTQDRQNWKGLTI